MGLGDFPTTSPPDIGINTEPGAGSDTGMIIGATIGGVSGSGLLMTIIYFVARYFWKKSKVAPDGP